MLHAPPPVVAQLGNHHPAFVAAYDRVSGTERYVDGEYLYTDHLYDDFGSDTTGSGGGPRAESAGKVTYPTDAERFGDNAADLVELRLSTRGSGLAVRVTLNTLLAADVPIAAVAFDADRNEGTGSATLPSDPGAPVPGTDHVLTMWGTGASWSSWVGAEWRTVSLEIETDLEANQMTTIVPSHVVAPHGTWRATAAVGLHDGAGGWLRPGERATAATPGGAGAADPDPSGIFNLAFRFDEAVRTSNAPPDEHQAAALLAAEPTAFAHDIDFDLLRSRGNRSTVPTAGTMVRFFPSRLDLGEGRITRSRGGADLLMASVKVGRLQPYSVFVPERPTVAVPLTLYLHSLNQHHWQLNGSIGVQQVGAGRGNVVLTPDARGSDGWYQGIAEYDVFEAWNDLASWIDLDPERTSIAGYSMGGHGTYRLGGLYPDLFARAATIVGPPGEGIWVPGAPPTGGHHTLTNGWLENTRNLPFLNVAAVADELVPYVGPVQQNVGPATPTGLQSFDQLGHRFRFVTFPTADHFLLGLLGYDLPMVAEFLGDHAVEHDPVRVTYSAVPSTDDPTLGLVHDGAYWVSAIELADPSAGAPVPKATVDATSHGFGVGQPATRRTIGTGSDPLPYTEVGRSWGSLPRIPEANHLDLVLTNVGSATLDLARARLTLREPLVIASSSTSPTSLTLRWGAETRVVEVPAGEVTIELAPLPAPAGARPTAAAARATPHSPTPASVPSGSSRLPATGGGLGGLPMAAAALSLSVAVRQILRRGPTPS